MNDAPEQRGPRPEPDSPNEPVSPDSVLHSGPAGEVTAEDLVLASGRDVTPGSLEWARRRLAEDGPAAMEKLLP